jgi:heme-binding NEAT domain protein
MTAVKQKNIESGRKMEIKELNLQGSIIALARSLRTAAAVIAHIAEIAPDAEEPNARTPKPTTPSTPEPLPEPTPKPQLMPEDPDGRNAYINGSGQRVYVVQTSLGVFGAVKDTKTATVKIDKQCQGFRSFEEAQMALDDFAVKMKWEFAEN